MTSPTHLPLTTFSDVTALWLSILGSTPPHGRSLWLAFVDGAGHAQPALTQIDGLNLSPEPLAVGNLGMIVRGILSDAPDLTGALICLERGGTTGAAPFEERWADALTVELGTDLAWPVAVRTPGGVSRVPLWTSAA